MADKGEKKEALNPRFGELEHFEVPSSWSEKPPKIMVRIGGTVAIFAELEGDAMEIQGKVKQLFEEFTAQLDAAGIKAYSFDVSSLRLAPPELQPKAQGRAFPLAKPPRNLQ